MKNIKLLNLVETIILFFCILLFFANGNVLTRYLSLFQYAILILSVVHCLLKGKITTNYIFFMWVIIILYFGLGLVYSYDTKATLTMLKLYVMLLPILICEFDRKKIDKFFKILEIVIIIGAISIIASVFIENMIQNYFKFFITTDSERTLSELIQNSYSGLFSEKGNAAFMLDIGIGIIIAKYLSNKKMNVNIFVELLLFVIALILTNKRALLVFPIIIFGIIYMFFKDKNKILKILKIVFIGIVALVILLKVFPVMGSVFDRFINDDDNHRSELKEICLLMHENNSIVGMGLNSYNTYAYNIGFRLPIAGTKNGVWTYHAHNIYYQLLAECGYIGITLIIFTFCYSIYRTIKLLRECDNTNDRKCHIVLSLYIQLLFVLYGATGNTFYYYQQILIYFIALAIAIREINFQRKKISGVDFLGEECD